MPYRKTPDFLPPIVSMVGDWNSVVNALYRIFATDFKWNSTFHNGLRVDYNRNIKEDGDGKEEGFWHVITKNETLPNGSIERVPDYKRAERLPWAKPLLISEIRPEILVFDYIEGPKNKGVRKNIWLKDFNYAIILLHRGTKYFWLTAFYVDEQYGKTLQKHYEKRA